MLVIIDAGANNGSSIKKFQNILDNKGISDYIIHSFEPVSFYSKYLEPLKGPKVQVHYEAVSTKDDMVKIYIAKLPGSSSLYGNKTSGGIDPKKFEMIKSVDINSFILGLEADEIWLKMDIEGEEYNVIKHLHEGKGLARIDKLFIEWHYDRIPNISKEEHEECVALVKHLKPEVWDTMSTRDESFKQYNEYYKKLE